MTYSKNIDFFHAVCCGESACRHKLLSVSVHCSYFAKKKKKFIFKTHKKYIKRNLVVNLDKVDEKFQWIGFSISNTWRLYVRLKYTPITICLSVNGSDVERTSRCRYLISFFTFHFRGIFIKRDNKHKHITDNHQRPTIKTSICFTSSVTENPVRRHKLLPVSYHIVQKNLKKVRFYKAEKKYI